MTISAAVLVVGAELLDGRVVDTNSNFLCDEFAGLGLEVVNVLSCQDTVIAIVDALTYLSSKSDWIIVSGGLGPTTDDLTGQAIAKFVSPRTLEEIDNSWGTASGLLLNLPDETKIAALPGVPSELKNMWQHRVKPLIEDELADEDLLQRRFLRVFPMRESELNDLVASVSLPTTVEVSYRTRFPENQLVFKGRDLHEVQAAADAVRSALGVEREFSHGKNYTMEEAVHNLLLELKETVAVAESCTGGGVGSMLTDLSGSSEYFLGGVIAYSNQIKEELLGVRTESLQQFGAVSAEVAMEMAVGVRKKFSSSIGISITGIAGPTGGSEEKPVGTFYLGFASESCSEAFHYLYPRSRERVRTYATYSALNLLRLRLLKGDKP